MENTKEQGSKFLLWGKKKKKRTKGNKKVFVLSGRGQIRMKQR